MFGSNRFFQVISGFLAFGFTILQGIDWVFTKYNIDGKIFNYILIGLFSVFIISLFFFIKKNKNNPKNKSKTGNKKGKIILIGNVILTGLFLVLFLYFFRKSKSKDDLLLEQLPKIARAFEEKNNLYVFKKTKSLLDKFPDSEILKNYFIKSSWKINVSSDVDETKVYIKYYKDSIWNYVGVTPIDSLRVPRISWEVDDFNLKLVKGDKEFIPGGEEYGYFDFSLIDEVPEDFIFKKKKQNVFMNLPGVFFGSDNLIPPYAVSKTEVSNKQFKEFLDNGGYDNPEFWDFPISFNGKDYSFKNSIKLFSDKFGKPGPKNWTYGEFPDGEDNFPVNGISWFEARAYAKYRGLNLPDIFQWLDAANLSGFTGKLPKIDGSNFNSNKPRQVNLQANQSDLLPNIAGNVREWTTNSHGLDRKAILGGSFGTNEYTFNSFYSLSPFNRSLQNGLRLFKNFEKEISYNDTIVVEHLERNFRLEKDVSDEVFEVYKSQFDYPKTDLIVQVNKLESPVKKYQIEKFEMPTPYKSEEKIYGYIITSERFLDMSKPIIEFPSAGAIFNNKLNIDENIIKQKKYLLDEGYSIIIPVYHNTWGRKKIIRDWWPNETEEYKNTIIKIGKDFKRIVDFLETRNNFDFKKLSYYGYSWGSVTSNILLAIEKRVKSAVICVGGLMLQKSRKEIESHLYIRRIKIPILHIVGKLDGIFEFEESFLPWNELVGTPEKDKNIIILDNIGHGIPRDIRMKNHLKFLKKYN